MGVNDNKKKLQGLYGDEEWLVTDRKGIVYVTNGDQLLNSIYKGIYNAKINYPSGSSILYNDIVYLCIKNTIKGETPDTNPEKWKVSEGITYFPYVAYSTDNIGSNWTLTYNEGVTNYTATINSTVELTPPIEADFTSATWVRNIGANGVTVPLLSTLVESSTDGIENGVVYTEIEIQNSANIIHSDPDLQGVYQALGNNPYLVDKTGRLPNIPKISGTGLDAIYDFSILNDLRFNKNAQIFNTEGLPEYYDDSIAYIYSDVSNPYHWKLTDFHYKNLRHSQIGLRNQFFATVKYEAGVLNSVDEILIYSAEKNTNQLRSIFNYTGYKLPLPYQVVDAIPRLTTKNSTATFPGATRTVGVGGDYPTLIDALDAAISGDTISILNDLLGTDERYGYFMLNHTKSLHINGNGHTLSGSTTDYLVRLRLGTLIKFSNIIVDSTLLSSLYLNSSNYGDSTFIFENCKFINTNNGTSYNLRQSGSGTFVSEVEFISCDFRSFYGYNVNCTYEDNGYIYDEGCTFYSKSTTYSNYYNKSKLKSYSYDSDFAGGGSYQVGENVNPLTYNCACDIRGCTFMQINQAESHLLLIGRGVNSAYVTNNALSAYGSVNAIDLGLVIKSVGVLADDCFFAGNYSIGARPLYLKGASLNHLIYNTSVSNFPSNSLNSGLHMHNTVDEIPINSNNNTIEHNNLNGSTRSLRFTNDVGAEDIATSIQTSLFDNNSYGSESKWCYLDGVEYTFEEKNQVWTVAVNNDVNSEFDFTGKLDAYINE